MKAKLLFFLGFLLCGFVVFLYFSSDNPSLSTQVVLQPDLPDYASSACDSREQMQASGDETSSEFLLASRACDREMLLQQTLFRVNNTKTNAKENIANRNEEAAAIRSVLHQISLLEQQIIPLVTLGHHHQQLLESETLNHKEKTDGLSFLMQSYNFLIKSLQPTVSSLCESHDAANPCRR